MSIVNSLNEKAIAVEVPEDLSDPILSSVDGKQYIIADKGDSSNPEFYMSTEPLPPGSWSILGKGNELTEEQWNGIVEQIVVMSGDDLIDGFKDYCDPVHGYVSPIPSGLSLLKSKGLNPTTTLILIKQ